MNSNLKFILLVNFGLLFNFISAQEPTDCIDAVIACGNSQINLDVNGAGTQELFGSNACFGQENNSVWLKVTTVTTGTLGFTLKPESTDINEDYDFFVFGPNVSCSAIGQAIRCSTTNPSNANLTSNFTGMNAVSTDTSEGPGADGNSFVRWIDAQAGETYFIVIDRPVGQSAFSLEWTGTATFSSPPSNEATTSGVPLNMEDCDVTAPFDDGLTTFNLDTNTNAIRGSQKDVSITYHASESDANIGIDALTSPFTNTSNPQTIHTRITNTITGCFELSKFTLTVNIGPPFTEPLDYILCDNFDDGDNTNGRTVFTLSSKNAEILSGQSLSDFNITYHSTVTGAEFNTPGTQLPDSYYNNTPFSEEIFVRIEDASNVDCKSVTSLKLTVNPVPNRTDHTMLQCDEDGVLDGITLFNLTEANDALTSGLTGFSTKFYTDSGRPLEIMHPENFPNTSNPQTIYVEIINDNTSCKNNAELTLSVSVTDAFDTALVTCDDDGTEDGLHIFNLADANSAITTGLPAGLDMSYYKTYEDALLEQNALNASYTNEIPYAQIIYARVENDNNCYGISEITLTVNELPDIEVEELTYYCTNFFPDTVPINAGLNTTNLADYSFNWDNGAQTYTIQINSEGNYKVTVTNKNTGCIKDRTITVAPSNTATFEAIHIIDASQNNMITVNVSGEGTYQYSLLNPNNSIYKDYQDSHVFENVKPGIYTVAVKDIKNNCGTKFDSVSVIGFPKFFTPNNDGKNDTWQVDGISGMFQPNTKILIYNRYGKLMKELNPLGDGWDGMLNGQILPPDDYWFSVKLQDGRVIKNHFTLKQ
ncbi:T9SS type B sorting domain-containing protein [Algibacter sp. 2305UL17-15]|uniref:T9SS type B sorting domain-containing protein n=1 Tax=Algibacter sp. 2305UL17-15 TaxID=3231268 RepID=UPI00345A6AA1